MRLFQLMMALVCLCDMCLSRRTTSIWCMICSNTSEECTKPEDCRFGEATDYCDRQVCAKGPGELCGDTRQMYGICADGLQCKRARPGSSISLCHGCYLGPFGPVCSKL